MRSGFFFMVMILLTHTIVWAQKDVAPVKERFRIFKSAVNRKLDKLDTIKLPSKDSLQRKFNRDSLKFPQQPKGFKNNIDSIQNRFSFPDTIQRRMPAGSSDSLRRVSALPNQTDLPTDTLQQVSQQAKEKLEAKSAEVQSRIRDKANSLQISEKLNGLQQKLPDQSKIKVPGDQPDIGLPSDNAKQIPVMHAPSTSSQSQLPGSTGMNLPGIKSSTDVKTDLPLSIPKGATPDLTLPETVASNPSEQLKEKLNLPAAEIPDIHKPDSAMINKLKEKALQDENLKKYAEPMDKISTKVDPYKKRLDSLTIQDAGAIAAEELEAHVTSVDEVKVLDSEVQKAKAVLTAQQELAILQRYQDKKIIQAELVRKTKNVANDKLGALSPKITEHQDTYKKARKTHSSVQSVKNMPKKRENEMKQLAFYERIQPGFSVQPYTGKVFSIDLSPQISYRTTKYASIGIGGVYRMAFDRKYDHFFSSQGLYGLRGFVNYRLVKGLSVYGEVERLTLRASSELSDKSTASAVYNMNVGLGKRYKVSPKIYGSVLALYRIEFGNHIPGTSRFNLRMVFEYRFKQKPKDE